MSFKASCSPLIIHTRKIETDPELYEHMYQQPAREAYGSVKFPAVRCTRTWITGMQQQTFLIYGTLQKFQNT